MIEYFVEMTIIRILIVYKQNMSLMFVDLFSATFRFSCSPFKDNQYPVVEQKLFIVTLLSI